MDEVEQLWNVHLHIISIGLLATSHSALRCASKSICLVDQRRIFLSYGEFGISTQGAH